jgi:polar amino acid transport system ATP-binding protein
MTIETDHLCKSYDNVEVLKNVSISVKHRHAITIIGPSGGGKTTLLRILAGLEHPSKGSVEVNGHNVEQDERSLREYRKSIGMVFQSYNLFPHLTALRNITLPLEQVHGYSSAQARARAQELLSRFQLEPHAHKRPGQLSGGQKQRIALSRAMAINPQFLVLDEPTSALDPELTAEVLDMIIELRREDTDLLLVTHHMGFARSVSDHILFVADGEIKDAGAPAEVFESSHEPKVQRFLDRILRYEATE